MHETNNVKYAWCKKSCWQSNRSGSRFIGSTIGSPVQPLVYIYMNIIFVYHYFFIKYRFSIKYYNQFVYLDYQSSKQEIYHYNYAYIAIATGNSIVVL